VAVAGLQIASQQYWEIAKATSYFQAETMKE